MTIVEVKLVPVAAQDNNKPIFEPASIPCGRLTAVHVLEKGTESGRTAVAFLIEMPDGSKIMTKTTALIMDGILGAVRAGCLMWGDMDNYKNDPKS